MTSASFRGIVRTMGDNLNSWTRRRTRAPGQRRNVVPIGRFRRQKSGRTVPLVLVGLILGSVLGWGVLETGAGLAEQAPSARQSLGIGCVSPKVTDGDTIRCGSTRIRLSSIDAPELPGHCRKGRECTPGDPYASTDNLRALVKGEAVQCRQVDTDHYGRAVAFCSVKGQDLSCAQYEGGYAVMRYGFLSC